ncbi:MAG: hypothetical protein HY909_12580 [Deltaproteobacteria bacterium]|nr:hypothetical protein [Deltaproteobacteria bacterium]
MHRLHGPLEVVIFTALAACSGDGSDPHGHTDAGGERVDGASLDAGTVGDASTPDRPVDALGDASAEAGDGGATCDPPCGAGRVCCTDAHGHFPTCRLGSVCADAGG